MDRRSYLATAVSVAGTAVLAGCSGGERENQSEGSDATERDTTTGKRTEAHLEKAGEALQSAGEEISRESDKLAESDVSDGGVDFRTSTIEGYLDTASNELDAAEASASESQRERVDAARGYVAFAREITAFLDVFAEGYSQVSTGITYFRSERFEDAAEELESARKTLDDADEGLQSARGRAEQLDTSTLDEMRRVDVESMQTDLSTLEELMSVLNVIADGLRDVSLGMIDFTEASASIDREEYARAKELFGEAETDFASAHTTFEGEEESAPPSVKSSVIELTCYSGALQDASTHFATASEALEDGDRELAKEESEKGEKAVNRCDFS